MLNRTITIVSSLVFLISCDTEDLKNQNSSNAATIDQASEVCLASEAALKNLENLNLFQSLDLQCSNESATYLKNATNFFIKRYQKIESQIVTTESELYTSFRSKYSEITESWSSSINGHTTDVEYSQFLPSVVDTIQQSDLLLRSLENNETLIELLKKQLEIAASIQTEQDNKSTTSSSEIFESIDDEIFFNDIVDSNFKELLEQRKISNALQVTNIKLMNNGLLGISNNIIKIKAEYPNHMIQGRTMIGRLVKMQKSAAVESLLKAGANPNQKDMLGNSALHFVANASDTKIIDMLLSAAADVNATNNKGETVLILEIKTRFESYSKSSEERKEELRAASLPVIQKLLSAGAKLSTKDSSEKSALDYAKEYEVSNDILAQLSIEI